MSWVSHISKVSLHFFFMFLFQRAWRILLPSQADRDDEQHRWSQTQASSSHRRIPTQLARRQTTIEAKTNFFDWRFYKWSTTTKFTGKSIEQTYSSVAFSCSCAFDFRSNSDGDVNNSHHDTTTTTTTNNGRFILRISITKIACTEQFVEKTKKWSSSKKSASSTEILWLIFVFN